VVTPSGERISQSSAGEGNEGLLELNEQGVYEIRTTGAAGGRPEAIAVNIDPTESDLSAIDPRELVAAVTGHASPTDVQPAQSQEMTREESERRQSLWWYLLMAGLLLLAAETVISNQLSRKEKFL
jgi:hypothetical protein